MKPEQELWAHLRDGMGAAWEAYRIDDHKAPDVPDVWYEMPNGQCGWIELKVGWISKRTGGWYGRIPSLTHGQVRFAARHTDSTPRWVLVRYRAASSGAVLMLNDLLGTLGKPVEGVTKKRPEIMIHALFRGPCVVSLHHYDLVDLLNLATIYWVGRAIEFSSLGAILKDPENRD